MATITIKVPENAKNKLSEFVKELGGEILSVKASKKSVESEKASVVEELRQGIKEAKLIRDGKMDPLSMSDLLNGE